MSIGERGLMKPDTYKVKADEIKVKLERAHTETVVKQEKNEEKNE